VEVVELNGPANVQRAKRFTSFFAPF